MTFGSLFAGAGGIDLGFEAAGMRCAFQVEIDKTASSVLAHHWPDVHRDILADTETPLADQPIAVKCGKGKWLEVSLTEDGIDVRMCGDIRAGTDHLAVIPVVSNVIRVSLVTVAPAGR
jgi:site-specific DNA-cytosine methylase